MKEKSTAGSHLSKVYREPVEKPCKHSNIKQSYLQGQKPSQLIQTSLQKNIFNFYKNTHPQTEKETSYEIEIHVKT